MIRIVIPTHLRVLAGISGEVQLDVPAPVTQRESPAQCVVAHAPRKGKVPFPSDFSMPHRAPQPHDITDHLCDRLEMLRRDRFIDLHRGVQGARQRRIFHHRHVIFFRHGADTKREGVHAFGDTDRRQSRNDRRVRPVPEGVEASREPRRRVDARRCRECSEGCPEGPPRRVSKTARRRCNRVMCLTCGDRSR